MNEQSHPIQSISAVTLLTADMRTAVAFYRDVGFEILYGGADAVFTSFRVGTGFLNLQQADDNPPLRPIWGRVVFWVEDVDDVYQQVVGAGYEPETEPLDASWGERYFHIRDPDGHELSFARPLRHRRATLPESP
jgi:catechol 2,3-dioxygenase-like lactoylglutathione lyase family enzyme